MSPYKLSTLLLLICIAPLPGQHAENEPIVSVVFKMLGWSDHGIENISYRVGTSLQDLVIPGWRRSNEEYVYRGPATLEFYLNKDKETGPVATTVLQPEIKRYTILMLTHGAQYRALALPDDPEHSPIGKARVINFTANKIALRTNDKDVAMLEPRGQVILSPNTGSKLLKVQMDYEADGDWHKTGIQRIIIVPTQQTTLFYVTSKADFFKSGEGNIQQGPQPFLLRQDAPTESGSENFFRSGTGSSKSGPQNYIITQ